MAAYYGDNILETPPLIIALFFTAFIVATVIFEVVLHILQFIVRKNRGLRRALEKCKTELMLLGMCALLIVAFSKSISGNCIPATKYESDYGRSWIDSVNTENGTCPCCLTRTMYISPCVLQAKNCGSDGGSSCMDACQNPQNKTCSLKSKNQYSSVINPKDCKKKVECKGQVQVNWGKCNEKSRPMLGPNTLKQIDIFIFVIASMHVLCGVLLICSVNLRVWVWTKKTAVETGRDPYTTRAIESIKNPYSQGPEESVPLRGPTWQHRPHDLVNRLGILKELGWCFLRQCSLFAAVSRKELWLMSASFHFTHKITDSSFDYMDFVRKTMGYDTADVVGLGIVMWLSVIIYLLLSWLMGWAIWVFILFNGILLLITNTKLVWLARYMTRGGRINTLEPDMFWFRQPRFLLHVIKFLLFFTSFIFSNAIFFAGQFGTKSCFFSSRGFQHLPNVPWWGLMTINGIYLLSLCCVTMPLYSVVVILGDAASLKIELMAERHQEFFPKRPQVHDSKFVAFMKGLGRALWFDSHDEHH